MDIRLSAIVATVGRPSLERALRSVASQLRDGDEIVVVGNGPDLDVRVQLVPRARFLPHPSGNNWGYVERQFGMERARGTHLLFVDDDDILLPGAVAAVRAQLEREPDRPAIFQMLASWGEMLPLTHAVVESQIGGPCFVPPNVPARLGRWGLRYEGDFDFVASTLAHYPEGPVYVDTLIYVVDEFVELELERLGLEVAP